MSPSATLTTEHPLQPFSREYFGSERPELFSYAEEWHRVHRLEDRETASSASERVDETHPPSLGDLAQLLKKPWRVYLRHRLDVPPRRDIAVPEDDEPFALDPLGESQLSAQLLDRVVTRMAREPAETLTPEILEERLPEWIDAAFDRISGSGQLPLAPFDQGLRRSHGEALGRQLHTWAAFQTRYPERMPPFHPDEKLTTGGEPTLTGEIRDVRLGDEGAVRLRLLPGALHKGPHLKWHRLVSEWPAHLAAQLGGQPVTTYLISESDAHKESLTERPVTMAPIDPASARVILEQLIDRWQQAGTAPLPAEPRSQIAWLIGRDEWASRTEARKQFQNATQFYAELTRLWSNFDALANHPEFEDCARDLFLALARGTSGSHQKALQPEGDE